MTMTMTTTADIKAVAASIAADLASLETLGLAAQKLRESIAHTMKAAHESGLKWRDVRKDLLHAISSTTQLREDGNTVPRWSASTSNLIVSTLKTCWDFKLMVPSAGLANPDRFRKAGIYRDWDGLTIELTIPVNSKPPKEPAPATTPVNSRPATTPAPAPAPAPAPTPATIPVNSRPATTPATIPVNSRPATTPATVGTDDGLNPIERMLAYVDRADKEGNGEPFRVYLNMVERMLSLEKDTLRPTMRRVSEDTRKAMEAKKK